jgi:hypothetical protein
MLIVPAIEHCPAQSATDGDTVDLTPSALVVLSTKTQNGDNGGR